MKKILETSLGHCSDLYFSDQGERVQDSEVVAYVVKRCDDYELFSNGGVLVHMTKAEFDRLRERPSDN